MGMILRIASSRIVGVRGYERMCTRKKDVERLSCGFEIYIYEREETGSFLRLSLCVYLALHYLCIIF